MNLYKIMNKIQIKILFQVLIRDLSVKLNALFIIINSIKSIFIFIFIFKILKKKFFEIAIFMKMTSSTEIQIHITHGTHTTLNIILMIIIIWTNQMSINTRLTQRWWHHFIMNIIKEKQMFINQMFINMILTVSKYKLSHQMNWLFDLTMMMMMKKDNCYYDDQTFASQTVDHNMKRYNHQTEYN